MAERHLAQRGRINRWRDGTVTEINAVEVRAEDTMSYSNEDRMI